MKRKFRLLIIAFAVSFALAGILAFFTFSRFTKLERKVNEVEQSHKVIRKIAEINSLLQRIDKAGYWYIFTLDSSYQHEHVFLLEKLFTALDSFAIIGNGHLNQRRLGILFKADILLYQDRFREKQNLLEQRNSDSLKIALCNYIGKPIEDALRISGLLTLQEIQTVNAGTQQTNNFRDETGRMMKTLGILFSLLTTVLFFFMVKEFRRRHLAQNSLRQSLAELTHSNSELEQIAYLSSHDLQEPVRKIRVLIDRWQLLQKGQGNPETDDTIERLNRTADKMHDLVAGLMILTALRDEGDKELCALSEIVGEILGEFNDKIEAVRGIVSKSALPEIYGSAEQLSRLFRSLLENAIKFSRPDVPLHLVISTLNENIPGKSDFFPDDTPYHVIAITDNGVGFDNKSSEKMFEIFRTMHDKDTGGHGLGLAICKRIMVNHGGFITAHGFPNEGATFKLYFPA